MKKKKQEYQLRSDGLIIGNWKFTSNGFIYVEGEKDMKHEELLNKIDEQIKVNLDLKAHSLSTVTNNVLRNNNNLLGEIKDALYDAGEEYDRGAEDVWALARKIICGVKDGGYSDDEVYNIFGYRYMGSIFSAYKTYAKVMAKVEAYEQKKKEEAEKQKIKLGDVVVNEAWNIPFMVTELDLNDGWIRGYDGDGQPHKFIWPNNCIHKVGKASDLFRLGKALSDGKDTESV